LPKARRLNGSGVVPRNSKTVFQITAATARADENEWSESVDPARSTKKGDGRKMVELISCSRQFIVHFPWQG
jgi:hypothetical protein